MINVTKTWLPDKKKYIKYLDKIYSNAWITNNGPFVQELEERLADYLGVKNIILVSNGTIGLEIAYRVLGIKNYAITTPFSFVATTSSLVANGINPIFVDIDQETFLINHKNIEESITPHTEAVVPVHVFGNACDIDSIEEIAKKYNLKVIYDAAHAFGVKYKGKNILNYGDISVLSFHATKLFHTIEGGALIINNDELVQKARCFINFGIENPESIPTLGINAKMNEFEAAMGLCVLDDIDIILEKRRLVYENYEKSLKDILQLQRKNPNATLNYSYFSVVFESEEKLKQVRRALNDQNVFPRRYFYPSLDTLNYIEPKQHCPISRNISSRILSLPLYPDLDMNDQKRIIEIIKEQIG